MSNEKPFTSPLLAGLKGTERMILAEQLRASEMVLKRLDQLMLKELESVENSTPDFKSPSWAYEQAYNLGLKKGLTLFRKYAII